MRLPRPATIRPPRRHTWDPRRVIVPPPPPAPPATVLEVQLLDAMTLIWFFSAPVTITGGGGADPPCPQLQANDRIHGWVGALGVEAYDAAAVLAYYPVGTTLDLDSLYRVIAPPDNLAFAGGLALPQSGQMV